MNDPASGLAAAAGLGIIVFVVYLTLMAGAIALGIWLTYTIIWRAVRRGLREYHHPSVKYSKPARGTVAPQPFGGNPRNW